MTQRHISGPTFVKVRFRSTDNYQYTLRGYQLLATMGAVATSTNVALPIYESARMLYCKIVGAPPAAGNTSEVKCEIGGSQQSTTNPRDLIINSSNNPNTNPMIYAKPNKNSGANDWFNAGASGPVISFFVPANSIIEMGFMAMTYEEGNTMATYAPAQSVTPGTFVHPQIYSTLEVLA